MTRFIIFMCLLAVQFNHGLSVKTVMFISGNSLTLKVTERGVNKCVVETNKGRRYTYKPDYKFIDENNKLHSDISTCSLSIAKPFLNDTGYWKITQYYENKEFQIYDYYIYSEMVGTISPSETIIVYEGHYVTVKIANQLGDIIACNVTNSKKETFDILSESKRNVEKYGHCGVRILVNSEHQGKWHLYAIYKTNELVSAKFNLDVQNEDKVIKEQQNITLELRSPAKITLDSIKSTYCQLTDSHGVKLPLTIGKCEYDIAIVTPYYDGLWKARYGLKGRLIPVEVDIMITTYDPDAVITNVNVTKDEVNILCRVRKRTLQDGLQYCLFISPNGTMLQISPGVGSGKYQFYQGTNEEITCGMTIHQPEEYDYGVWRCEMAMKYLSGLDARYGSILYLDYNHQSQEPTNHKFLLPRNINTFAENVMVKRNDSFTIKCSTNMVLNYCWLRSPIGTTYSIIMDKEKKNALPPKTLFYEGLGFSQGECGAFINNAVNEHQGKWSCYMGIKNHSEVEAAVWVTVTDSYVFAEKKEVTFNGRNNLNLSCHLLTNLSNSIDYCRWIRPDGRGIHDDTVNHRYTPEMYERRCQLIILGKKFQAEDVGRWTCVAGLTGESIQEVSTGIYVNTSLIQSTILTGIIIGTFVFFIIAVSIAIFTNFCKKKSAATLSKYPPPYDTVIH
ncbi:uncharacterized protein LOC124424298 isoform X1 [Vespa crabro]|uniref:uncharacterized protein LOC124424298 isoform X1 n=1 Tax=Vespa crabro TaxID=7445 RepID=UPI001F01E1B8|nr:uncharacterized protein LOC124424298 isoform X1 [Vespa crabro]